VLGQQLVEVVAGDAAGDARVPLPDAVGVAVAQVAQAGVDPPRRPPAAMIEASSSSLVGPTVIRSPS